MVEDVEGGHADRNHFVILTLRSLELEVVLPLEIDIGSGIGLEGVAAYAGGTGVAQAGMEVVGAGGLGAAALLAAYWRPEKPAAAENS